jgi:hypothetical protein
MKLVVLIGGAVAIVAALVLTVALLLVLFGTKRPGPRDD